MVHPRTAIRKAAAAALANATDAEDRVYPSRMTPVKRGELPALLVYTLEEPVDQESWENAPRAFKRLLEVAIEGVIQLSDEVDDALDALALQVETAIEKDPSLGGACDRVSLASTETGITDDGQQRTGHFRILYTARYWFTADPSAGGPPLDDFKVASTSTAEPTSDPSGAIKDVVILQP